MMQKHRIRTEIGQDQKLTVEIKQDYDLLEILSLKFTQQDIYTSLCADYGVVAGRISVNDGFGVANARVSIFIPLSNEDSNDPIISALYPYTSPSETNDDGYRYNLLPSRKQHTGHTPTGTFPDQEDILGREEVLEVYEKYYKYTVKTNDSGDFMIWGVPVGQQTIHVDVDMSDMGCQSLVPYDFIYEGVSEQKFENGYTFMSSNNIAGLPQITTFEKTIEIYPFWGNEDLCEIGITRTDFDLKEQGIRIEPYSIMMGGSFTDGGKDSVRVKCNVDNQMGEKCSLITGEGDIEAIRFTGEYEKNADGTLNYSRPKLESIQLDSEIDEDGNFFFRVPMNMGYVITNEFGETVTTKDRNKGIATRSTYRFRLSLQNDNGSKKQYRGKYLIPQIKEHQLGTYPNNYSDPKSYSFSTNIDEYPPDSIVDISGENNGGFANDYFYSFRYNRVYTVSSFINQYYNKSWSEKAFSFFVKDKNESFLGIKEIQPSIEEDCANNNEYFPITDAVRNHKFKFLIIIILNFLERIYLIITQFALDFIVEFLFDIAEILYKFQISISLIGWSWRPWEGPATRLARTAKQIQVTTMRRLSLINYPDCYECTQDPTTGDQTGGSTGNQYEYVTISSGNEEEYVTGSGSTTNGSYLIGSNVIGTHTYYIGDNPSNEYLTISITGISQEKNYVIKYVIKDEISETDEYGNVVILTPKEYGFMFIGYGSSNNIDITETKVYGVPRRIFDEIYDINNINTNPLPSTVDGTAVSNNQQILIDTIWFISEKTLISEGESSLIESGCEKYDSIYDSDNEMYLRAFVDSSGTGAQDYTYFIQYPNGHSVYPDIFIDTENPCTYVPPSNDIVATISVRAETHHIGEWSGNSFARRVVLKNPTQLRNSDVGWDGTASGYSEFSDGTYTLISATGKNNKLILNYSRRKLLGKLMCAGVTSYVFSNSWLNGSLYFFQFRRRRGGSNAKYCKDLIYRKEDDNGVHYYYRSTPYYGGNFIGQVGERPYGEILFPTTIMDLGPRNMFIKEICVDPELDVNCSVSKSIGNTSYQDINDLMEWVIASKEVKEQGKLQVQDLFDKRSGGGMDGDIVQLLNFNSQLGIYGYDDEDQNSPYFPVGGVEYFDGAGPLSMNFVFSEDDEDTAIIEKDGTLLRLCINSAGNLTETAQEVPFYKWDKRGDGFGGVGTNYTESQTWDRFDIHRTKYQGGWDYVGLMEPRPSGIPAGGDPTDFINGHYYDGTILPPIRECDDDNYADTKIPIGGPFFFYFGLRTGKTAWNKFIQKFGPL